MDADQTDFDGELLFPPRRTNWLGVGAFVLLSLLLTGLLGWALIAQMPAVPDDPITRTELNRVIARVVQLEADQQKALRVSENLRAELDARLFEFTELQVEQAAQAESLLAIGADMTLLAPLLPLAPLAVAAFADLQTAQDNIEKLFAYDKVNEAWAVTARKAIHDHKEHLDQLDGLLQ